MRLKLVFATLLLGAGMAQAQVVSPLGGSTSNPQSPPPATRTPSSPRSAVPAVMTPSTPAAGASSAAPSSAPATTSTRTRRSMDERFAAANTTHDGKLTLEQARVGRLRAVARDFDQIDTGKRGYVTLEEIKAHQSAQRAARRAAREQKPATAPPTH